MELRENALTVDTYLGIRAAVNWKKLERAQAEKALHNSLYTVVVYDGENAVGMGRIVGDGAVICYIQDLAVHPDYHGKGIGSLVIEKLIDYVKSIRMPGTTIMLDLMCAKGRETFYQKHQFIARPTNDLGPGMIQYIADTLETI